jgi:hypothetical protein
MQSMSFDPIVAGIGDRVVDIAVSCLEASAKASIEVIGLAPAGGDEVSAQAATAFTSDAIDILTLHQAAQEELMRTGVALTHIAQIYAQVDEAAARNVAFAAGAI